MPDEQRRPPNVPSSSRSDHHDGFGERRQATALFADLVGFTAFSERSGEEAAYSLMQRISTLMTDAIHEEGGTVRSFTGDGVMALFGVPIALEDAPLRACRAALNIQQRIGSAAAEIEIEYGLRPMMRIGINTGPMVVGKMQSGESTSITAIGDTVNLASRLQSLAEPGGVLLSEATHRIVQGLVRSRPAGEHEIKGKTERQKAFRLESIRRGAVRFDAALSRGLTNYVGRSRELDILKQALEKAADAIAVIDLAGEPGIGKSRLVHEFRGRLADEQVFVLSGSCTPDGQQTPFLPFIEVVRGSFRLSEGEAEQEITRKLEKGLGVLGLASEENLALLLNLLGLKPQEDALKGLDGVLIGLRTRDLLSRLLQERCRITPVVMILEDLHWIDSVSEELIARLVNTGEKRPLLIVCTRRPEYRLSGIEPNSTTEILLGPLSAADTSLIVRERLGVSDLPRALAKLVTDKAEGNPLFAEEIASYLTEHGMVRSRAGAVEYDAKAVAVALPGSVQALLTARIDSLATADRSLLQAAAVVGRSFAPELISAINQASVNVDARLKVMQAADLVYEAKSGEFVFKHALVRDVLYDGLLSPERTALHLKVAQEIERRSGNRLAEVAENLAHHYGRAGVGHESVSLQLGGRQEKPRGLLPR
jgi:class 3 adenylate cyclase